ncbi:MAG: type II secretion system protein GspM [Candidatus Binataceae bacterium]
MGLLDDLLVYLSGSAAGRYFDEARRWISPRYRQLRARYYKLEKRERMLVKVAGAIVVAFIAYNLIYLPILSYQADLEEEVAERQRDLTEVRQMAVIYRQVKTELVALEKNTAPPGKDFALSSVVSTALNSVVGNDVIAGISTLPNKPISDQFTQYGITLRLEGISLKQMVDVLYQIKSIKVPVVVSNLAIKKHGQDPHSYDLDMICSVLGKNA